MKVPLTKLIQLFASADSDSYHHSHSPALQPEKLPKKCSTTFWFPIVSSFHNPSKHLSRLARKPDITHLGHTQLCLFAIILLLLQVTIRSPRQKHHANAKRRSAANTHTSLSDSQYTARSFGFSNHPKCRTHSRRVTQYKCWIDLSNGRYNYHSRLGYSVFSSPGRLYRLRGSPSVCSNFFPKGKASKA